MHKFGGRHRWARGPHGGGWDRSDWGGHHRGRGMRHGGGMRRLFDQGDLRLIVLALIAEQPRHGYDLIKEIEARVGGAYAPSPGVIYPLLTLLEEMGLAQVAADGAKKVYSVTPEGEAELTANRAHVDALLQRISQTREQVSGGRSPQVMRAIENFKFALRLRLERGPIDDDTAAEIASIIDAAAQAVEKTGKR